MANWSEWLAHGWADLKTAGRQGLREIRNALYTESPIARDLDPGVWGNALQREIYEARHAGPLSEPALAASTAERPSVVDGHVKAAEAEHRAPTNEISKDAAMSPASKALDFQKE